MEKYDLKPELYEPKRQNRFIVEFPEMFHIPLWVVKSVTKPSAVNGSWNNIQIKFFDPITPSTSVAIFDLFTFCKKLFESNLKNNKPNDELFSFHIKSLDPVGNVVEDWTIGVNYVDYISFGELDYQSDDLQEISIFLRPTDCILNKFE